MSFFTPACKWAALAVLLVFLPALPDAQTDRVLLRDVTSITLRRGEYTAGRRSAPVPQLTCVGGTAYGKHAPKVVQCYNRGFDGRDVQWECKAELSNDYQFGKIEVSCEGYDYPNDPYILAGSCGLNYELDYTSSGAKRQSSYHPPTAPHYDAGSSYTKWIYLLIAIFVIYLVYTTLTAPREGNEGDRRGGGGGGGGYPGPGGGGPYPPGWRSPPPPPSYDETFGGNAGTKGTSQSGSSQTAPGGGPGFFTGLGLGALGGYFFGNRNDNTGGWGGWNGYGTRRRRYNNNYDTGANTGGGGYFADSAGPSTSSGQGSSSGTHSSSGFGGTSRR